MKIIENRLIKVEQADVQLGVLSIPEEVEILEKDCLKGIKAESINLPSNLKEIWAESFADFKCKKVSIPKSVKIIEDYAFHFNESIEEIVMNVAQKPLIKTYTFAGCVALRNVRIGLQNYAITFFGYEPYTILAGVAISNPDGRCYAAKGFNPNVQDETIYYICIPDRPTSRIDYEIDTNEIVSRRAYELNRDRAFKELQLGDKLTINTPLDFVAYYLLFNDFWSKGEMDRILKENNLNWTDVKTLREMIDFFHDTMAAQVLANQYKHRHEEFTLENRLTDKDTFMEVLMALK